MKFPIMTTIALTLTAATAVPVQAAIRTQSGTLRVETPASNPELAVKNAQSLYLHRTGDGRALLYVEEQNGRLAVLDVTTPSNIRRLADAAFTPAAPFDFVESLGYNAALIRYRDGSGYALLNLAHALQPVVESSPAIARAAGLDRLGRTGLLEQVAATTGDPAQVAETYNVVDTAAHGAPHVLATVTNVTEQAANGDTGTVFLLNQSGVTVVRRLRVEQEHQAELLSERGN
jgi:hypothetical protein